LIANYIFTVGASARAALGASQQLKLNSLRLNHLHIKNPAPSLQRISIIASVEQSTLQVSQT
jgi:hypothetical protein